MGYIRNHTIAVTGGNYRDEVDEAHKIACQIFKRHDLEMLVSPLVQHASNGGAAFFIAPDGSKEGWATSQSGDDARQEFKDWLRVSNLYLDWAEIVLGGDDGEYQVSDKP
jgi:hypothetical protein